MSKNRTKITFVTFLFTANLTTKLGTIYYVVEKKKLKIELFSWCVEN